MDKYFINCRRVEILYIVERNVGDIRAKKCQLKF